ncbi:MFS transporter [Actinomadura craniellae]|uniref:MFS transporter n=1 Tax=Actinomadura craniellae TaxID=2231787 RepID=A0A365H169_9ACTN|nr:MFS transporter [Actinomadura craniellae]RAY12821.1 MFS transporter [Actinomadura craniellae]
MAEPTRLLKTPNVRWYLGGLVLSLLASTALTLVAGIWVKTLTGSSSLAALATFCAWLPQLLAPAIGVAVDRVRRRALLVATNLAMVPVLAPLLLVRGPDETWMIFIVMALYGVSFTLIGAAEPALLASMLEPGQLGRVNGLRMSLQEGMKLVAPLIGAGLFGLAGGPAVAATCMLCFAAAAGLTARIRVREAGPAGARASWRSEMAAGLRHLAARPAVRSLVAGCSVVMLAFGFIEAAAYSLVADGLHRPPQFLGVVAALTGAGTIAGGLLAPRVMARLGEPRLTAAGVFVFAAGAALLSTGRLPAVVAGAVLNGAGVPWLVIGVITFIQRTTPTALLGRVLATVNALLFTPTTLGIAIGAGLVSVLSYRTLLLTITGITLCAGAYLIRTLPAPPSPTEPPS